MSAHPTRASAPPHAGLTRWTVTATTLLIAAFAFAFCFGNAHSLCISLGIDGWIAWLIGPSVDLSVIGLLLGVRYLALLGYSDAQLSKPRRLLILCGLLTLALNTADAITRGRYGTAGVDAIGPVLLICWSDVFSELRIVWEIPARQKNRRTVSSITGRCPADRGIGDAVPVPAVDRRRAAPARGRYGDASVHEAVIRTSVVRSTTCLTLMPVKCGNSVFRRLPSAIEAV